MSAKGSVARAYTWATTQRNLTIFVSILIAVPTAYAFQETVGSDELSGDFLLLMTLVVGVPTTYDEYWPQYDRTWKAIAWVLIAYTVATVEFTGLYIAGTAVANLSPLTASIIAFLVPDLGNFAWLAARQRQ